MQSRRKCAVVAPLKSAAPGFRRAASRCRIVAGPDRRRDPDRSAIPGRWRRAPRARAGDRGLTGQSHPVPAPSARRARRSHIPQGTRASRAAALAGEHSCGGPPKRREANRRRQIRNRRVAPSGTTVVAADLRQVYARRRRVEMPFALKLRELLSFRENLLPGEFAKGDTLESVLDNYLRDIEMSGDADMRTSILLLDGTTLRHGASPAAPARLSRGRRRVADRSDRRVVRDRGLPRPPDLCVRHRQRSAVGEVSRPRPPAWASRVLVDSDPQRKGPLLGTFAIYNLRPREVLKEEIESIQMITEHVARAIMWYRGSDYEADRQPRVRRTARRSPRGRTCGWSAIPTAEPTRMRIRLRSGL